MAKPVLEFLEVAKNYGEFAAVERMSLTLMRRRIFHVVGTFGFVCFVLFVVRGS